MDRIGQRKKEGREGGAGRERQSKIFPGFWISVIKLNSSNKNVLRLHENKFLLPQSNQLKKIWPL